MYEEWKRMRFCECLVAVFVRTKCSDGHGVTLSPVVVRWVFFHKKFESGLLYVRAKY
jgi:hypothetical protein